MPRSDDLRFRAGNLTLAGTLALPDREGPYPWAVLLGSWLPRDRDGAFDRRRYPAWFAPAAIDTPPGLLARLAGAFAELGVATLRFDPRGCGESDGAWEETDLFTRIDDARDAIGAMRSRAELDLRRMAIVGHGEGAVAAISAAIADPAIGAVGLIAPPARSQRDVLRRGVAARARTGADGRHPAVLAFDRWSEELIEHAERREPALPIRVGDDELVLNLAGLEQAIHTPALALATMLHRNVLIAHGADDAWVHPDESLLLAGVMETAGSPPDVMRIEGAGHDLAEADDVRIGELAAAIAGRMEARELPPVLVEIERMNRDG
jgi:alpha-beta hydrolase superfamily lysophospholipase